MASLVKLKEKGYEEAGGSFDAVVKQGLAHEASAAEKEDHDDGAGEAGDMLAHYNYFIAKCTSEEEIDEVHYQHAGRDSKAVGAATVAARDGGLRN